MSPSERLPSSCDQAWEQVADVDGWMTRGQSDLLCQTSAACPEGGRIVEIGSFQGRSIIVLAMAAPTSAELIAIDPHAGNDRGPQEIDGYGDEANEDNKAFHHNLAAAGVAERVNHLRKFSNEALDDVAGSIDVLYIDGAHRYRPALADIEQWGAKVGDGGALLIHDSFSSLGVTGAILRSLTFDSEFEFIRRSRSLALYRRRPGAAKGRNLGAHLGQLPYFLKNVGLKVVLASGGGRLWRLVGRSEPEWPY